MFLDFRPLLCTYVLSLLSNRRTTNVLWWWWWWKLHDRIFIHLDTIPERDGQTALASTALCIASNADCGRTVKNAYINDGRHAAIVNRLWAVWPHVRTFSEIDVAWMQGDSRLMRLQRLECTQQVQLPLTLFKHVDVWKTTSWLQQRLLHCCWIDTARSFWNSAEMYTQKSLAHQKTKKSLTHRIQTLTRKQRKTILHLTNLFFRHCYITVLGTKSVSSIPCLQKLQSWHLVRHHRHKHWKQHNFLGQYLYVCGANWLTGSNYQVLICNAKDRQTKVMHSVCQ